MAVREENGREKDLGPGERFGLVITNLIKLGGLVIVIVEVLARQEVRPSVLATSAFMLAGAQGLENLFKGLFGK